MPNKIIIGTCCVIRQIHRTRFKGNTLPLVRQHKHNLCGGFVLFSTLQFINGIPSDCSKPNFFDETFKTNTILKEKRKRERKTMC